MAALTTRFYSIKNISIFIKLLSLAILEIVLMRIRSAATDGNAKMMTFAFQCLVVKEQVGKILYQSCWLYLITHTQL